MSIELEAKMRVDSHDQVREALSGAGGQRVASMLEINTFFDTPERSLLNRGCGMRLRIHQPVGGESYTRLTYKGPKSEGALKSRQEIEFTVDDTESAASFLAALGYVQTLSFEKRRERWQLADCTIELDEMPYVGKFIEIEGQNEQYILAVRDQLNLAEHELITTSYAAMLAEYLTQNSISERVIRF